VMFKSFFSVSNCRFRVAVLMFVGLAAPLLLQDQTGGTGALTGAVTEPTGAVVRDAKVTATSVDTGQSRTSTTGADGTYSFNMLPPDDYRARFEWPRFQPVEIPSATVNVTETAVLDRSLTVGSATQAV